MLRSTTYGLVTVVTSLLLLMCQNVVASDYAGWVEAFDKNGRSVWLRDNRKPSLYTGDFGDCQGDSVINVTRFDAAYYKDNMTVMFHLQGNTALTNESLMMYIGVYAYGEARFNLTFNPCKANIDSMCPLNASVPIEANGIIPVSQEDVSGVPNIALSIPDFEGQAILRVFSNSTESQIACYSAVLTNGATFSHPTAIAPVLGAAALTAFIFSVLVSIHGDSVQDTRNHYAHGVSVFMVFAVYHHIFFTGALSMNWPSVLTAFWSNYAWSAGMIYNSGMQNTINKFLGDNLGNISMVGAAQSGVNAAGLGGGYSIAAIYKRGIDPIKFESYDGIGRGLRTRTVEQLLSKRDEIANRSTGFSWYGNPVKPGLPLPGNYSGFPGTLARENIAVSDAFMTAMFWFLILLAGLIVAVALLKLTVELFGFDEHRRVDRLAFFRRNWILFAVAASLRAVFIAFSTFMILTLFQLDFGGPPKVIAIASIFFVLFVILMFGLAGFAAYDRYKAGKLSIAPDRLRFEIKKTFGVVPIVWAVRQSMVAEKDGHKRLFGSLPWYGFQSTVCDDDDEMLAHDDDKFTVRFGWLVSRYRDSRWYFPAPWLLYEVVRACFYGGAANHPLIQVFGLLVVECVALFIFIRTRPFESTRLNMILVWILGFSKVLTVALSSAFEVRFAQDRIICTVIGIVIIVIQGGLTILLMIAVVIGSISSYMSLKRNHEEFRPKRWINIRSRYFRHIEQVSKDKPAPPPPPPPAAPPVPAAPYFKVSKVVRQRKIEDEDEDLFAYRNESPQIRQQQGVPNNGYEQGETPERTRSRAQSIQSQASSSHLPYGARLHRASWSAVDFENHRSAAGTPRPQPSEYSLRDGVTRPRAATMRSTVSPKFEVSPRKVRSSSFRDTGPDPGIFNASGPSSLERHSHRRQRSNSASQFLNGENITEEKEADLTDR